MNKLLKIAGLFLLAAMIMGCSNGTSGTEKFTKTTVFNPNSTKVKLISVSNSREDRAANNDEDVICEVEPLETKEVELGDEHEYFFTDSNGNKIADLSKSDSGQYLPVYLELNEPVIGKKYILLNQYKKDDLLENYPRYNNGYFYQTYELLLYEVVEKNDLNAYQYGDIYIRTYPSANYWIDSEGYASNKIGTIITYDEDFRNNFEPLSNSWVAWGWSTYNSDYDIWFCHRVVSYILHAKDDDNYTVKTVGPRSFVFTGWWNPANNGWQSSWFYTSYTTIEDDVQSPEAIKTTDEVIKFYNQGKLTGSYYFLFRDYLDNSLYLATATKDENMQISVNWKKVIVTTR